MVNEEIVTGLRNAIEHGENLQNAVQVMINSGYNPAEVQEASRFVGGGAISVQEIKPGEQLTMPSKKSFFSKFKKTPKTKPQPIPMQPTKQIQPPQQMQPQKESALPSPQQMQPLKEPIPPLLQPNQPKLSSQQQAKQIKEKIDAQTISLPIETSEPLTKQLNKISPQKNKHIKEIILVIVLLVLIGVLIVTIIFKDEILSWFS